MSTKPIQFLSIDDILRIHEIALKDQGGDPSIRDVGLLDSALAQPKQQFSGVYLHPDIPSMAAAYAFHICLNHPFVDGNKRAGTAAMIMFLSDNGWRFDATADEAEPVVLNLAAGTLDKASLTTWLKSHCHEKPQIELREFFARLDFTSMIQTSNRLTSHAPGATYEEWLASVKEASKAMPALRGLRGYLDIACESGTQQERDQLIGKCQLLLTLYRLAEDMGYEW